MELRIIPADPAGNITLLVETPVERNRYSAAASALLALPALRAEQVGFFAAPRMGGAVRLEMMGGEFCGNALRCAGLYCARQTGGGRRTIPVEISGCGRPLAVEPEPETGETWAEMPLPRTWERLAFLGRELDALVFEGIAHIILPGETRPLPAERLRPALRGAAERLEVSAVGLMRYDPAAGELLPAVYVRDTDSLVYENSCASGSTAAAVWQARRLGEDGRHTLCLRQAGGLLRTEVVVRRGEAAAVRLGGTVRLGQARTVTV